MPNPNNTPNYRDPNVLQAALDEDPRNFDLLGNNTDDDGFGEFAENLQAFYEANETEAQTLKRLYETDKQAYQNELDKLTEQIADVSPEYQDTLKNLLRLRQSGQQRSPEAADLKHRLNELFAMYQSIIVSEAGLPDENAFLQIEAARDNLKIRLQEALGDSYSTDEALVTLGIRSTDENGKSSYNFPSELMPDSANEKWKVYLASVCLHIAAAERFERNRDDPDSVIQADRERRYAHDAATSDVHAVLGFENIDPKWDKLKTRDLLAQIRDSVLPDRNSTKNGIAQKIIENHSGGLLACHLLSTHH